MIGIAPSSPPPLVPEWHIRPWRQQKPKPLTRLKNAMNNILSSTLTAFTRTGEATTAAICTPHQKANRWPAKVLPLNIPCRISANSFPLSELTDYAATLKSNPSPQEPVLSDHECPLLPPSIPLATVATATPSVAIPLTSRSMTAVSQM